MARRSGHPAGPRAADSQPATDGKTSCIARLLNLVEASVAIAAAVPLIGLLGRWHYAFDLAAHFRFQAASVLLLGGAILWCGRRRRWGAPALVIGLFLTLTIARLWWPQAHSGAKAEYRFVVMNVLTRNPQRSEVAAYLRDSAADILVVIEVDDSWEQALDASLSRDWPHKFGQPRGDNFGILLYSRHPLTEEHLREFSSAATPSIDAVVHLPSGDVRVVGTHPLPPMSHQNWTSRNAQLLSIGASVQQHPLQARTLLAGDLNCSRWSFWFRELIRSSGLRDSSLGFGTWPTWYPLPTVWGGLPIDHVCVGPDIVVQDRVIGPALGSDHRAVIVDFRLASATAR